MKIRILKTWLKVKSDQKKIEIQYFVLILLVIFSHWIYWQEAKGVLYYNAHLYVGVVVILIALPMLLFPFYLFARYSLETFTTAKEVEEFRIALNNIGKDIHELCDLDDKIKKHPLAKDFVYAASQLSVRFELFEKNTNNAIVEVHNKAKQVLKKIRIHAQYNLVSNTGRLFHSMVFLVIGFGALYYGLWGTSAFTGVSAFRITTGISLTLSDFLYYSSVVTITLGYGTIEPFTWVAQFFTLLQTLTGAFFLTGVVSILLTLLNMDDLYSEKNLSHLNSQSKIELNKQLKELEFLASKKQKEFNEEQDIVNSNFQKIHKEGKLFFESIRKK